MSSEPTRAEPLSETALLVKRLLAVDVVLAKAIGATDQQVYRVVERRMYRSLCAVFLPMADAALSEISALEGDEPATEAESKALAASISKHFNKWKAKTNDVVKTVVEDVYGSSKRQARARVLVLRKKSMRVSKAGPSLNASFNTEDEHAINALSSHQVFWIGQQYTDNLSKQISAFTDDFMLRSGLGRREAGERLKDALSKEFGLKSGPLDRSPGLELPAGWRGTTQQYFRMLSANTVTNARTQGALREMRSLGVTKFKVVNPEDEKTCPTCEHMDGRTFTTSEAVDRLDLELESDPNGVREIHPWAKNASELKQADSLMAAGYGYPPYHGDCRCGVDVDEESMPELQDIPDDEMHGAGDGSDVGDEDWDSAESFESYTFDSLQDWGATEWEHWASNLSNDDVKSFESYQGSAFSHINRLLRGTLNVDQIPLRGAKLQRDTENIASALNAARCPKDIIAYRGVAQDVLGDLVPGAVLQDKAFTSATLHLETAIGFGGQEGALMEIFVPKGSHAAFVDAATKFTYGAGEAELLLQKGSKFRVLSVDRKDLDGHMRTVVRVVAEVP